MNRFWFLHPGDLWHVSCDFLADWWSTRRWSSLLYGSPALLICLTLTAIWHFDGATGSRALVDRYSQTMLAARQAADYDKAEVCLQKLIALEPQEDGHRN